MFLVIVLLNHAAVQVSGTHNQMVLQDLSVFCCVYLPSTFQIQQQGSIFLSEIVKKMNQIEDFGSLVGSKEMNQHVAVFSCCTDALCSEYLLSSPFMGPITRVDCKCFISGHACISSSDEGALAVILPMNPDKCPARWT